MDPPIQKTARTCPATSSTPQRVQVHSAPPRIKLSTSIEEGIYVTQSPRRIKLVIVSPTDYYPEVAELAPLLEGEWRSGSAAALHAVGRGFESLFAYHFSHRKTHLFWPLPDIARSIWRFLPLLSRVALLKIIICKRGSDSLFACNSKSMNSFSALASLQKGWTVEGGGVG